MRTLISLSLLMTLVIAGAMTGCGGGSPNETTLRREVEQSPQDTGKRIALAKALNAKGAYREAIVTLQDGQKTNPDNVDILKMLAQTYWEWAKKTDDPKQWEKAIPSLAKLSDMDVQNEKRRDNLIYALSMANRHRQIIKRCIAGLQTSPNDGYCLIHLGHALSMTGQYERAEPLLEQGAASRNGFTDLWWLADNQRLLGEYQRSLETFKKAAALNHDQTNNVFAQHFATAQALVLDQPSPQAFYGHYHLGGRHRDITRNDRMAAEYETALRLVPSNPRLGDWPQIGWSWEFVGEFKSGIGRFEEAIECGKKAVDAYSRNDPEGKLPFAYQSLACTYGRLGEAKPERTKEMNEKTLDARVKEEEWARKYNNEHLARHAVADKAYALCKVYGAKDERTVACRQEAAAQIPAQGPINDCSFAAIAFGEAYFRGLEEDYEGSAELYERVLSTYEHSTRVEDFQAAPNAFGHLAAIAIKAKKYDEAIAYCERSLQHFQKVRAMLGADEFRRLISGNTWRDIFAPLLAAEIEKKDDAAAFNSAEEYKARALLDLLASRPKAAPANAPVAAPQSPASAQTPGQEAAKTDAPLDERVTLALRDLNVEQTAYARLPENKSAANLLVKSIENAQTLKLNDLQPVFQGITFVSYLLGNDNSAVVVVNGDGAHVVALRDLTQKKVTDAVEAFRKNMLAVSQTKRDLQIEAGKDTASKTAGAELKKQSEELYDWLVAPVLPYMTVSLVCISPDGILNYLPFEALQKDGRYLVEDYVVSYAPSANILKFCLEKNLNRHESILALGNPNLQNPAFRLFNAENEVNSVKDLFARADAFTGDAATETSAKERASDYDVLHFACHGELNTDNPMLTSLRLAPDDKNDGYLHAGEIFDMNLHASLVVLSACNTGLGELTSGNELMGLTRSFLYAGAPAIIASLWTVDDKSTALLMQEFYKNWTTMNKTEALRQAKLAVMKDYPNPFYWAAFCLQGDYR